MSARRHAPVTHRPSARRASLLSLAAAVAGTALLAGCFGSDDDDAGGSVGGAQGAPAFTTPEGLGVSSCDALPDQTDSLDFGGVQFSPTPNGLSTGQALAHALMWPYYVSTWPRADHESWIIVGVSGGMVELQAELDALFPGARVLAMNISWHEQQLASLADQVRLAVSEIDPEAAIDWSIASGRVSVAPSTTSDEFWDAIEAFAGLPVCVDATGAG